jgi:hypothetical protein
MIKILRLGLQVQKDWSDYKTAEQILIEVKAEYEEIMETVGVKRALLILSLVLLYSDQLYNKRAFRTHHWR